MKPKVFEVDGSSVTLWWEGVAGAESYGVQMRLVGEEFRTLSTTLGAPRVRKKGLEAGQRYEWRVACVANGGEVGEWSEIVSAGPTEAHQMEPPRVSDYDGESATVHWLPRQTIGGVPAPPPYALQIFEGGWTLASEALQGDKVLKHHLEPGVTYHFRVKPVNAPNFEWSRASEGVTIPRPEPRMAQAFGPTLLKGSKRLDTVNALAGKLVAVYASASCFDASLGRYPFLAVPFDAPQRETALAHFKVTAIPRLIVLSPRGDIIVDNAAGMQGLTIQAVDAWLRNYR
ncbi:hypothetical protein CTAYLR_005835 [Chrysophaeum taylorii]|uniref:Fibronectin type-III domain-containing protein n=1 Tax=Chrysophaeum taylorii TaxID=2483200 RepID=A0AAD7UQB5_9STRA|nr:hypothetical protein CTAYLR_005835 [Chrysophaeum taylorii]